MRLTILPLLLLAACDGGSEPATNQTAASTPDARAALKAMAPGLRDGVLIRAIRDADQPCDKVTDGVYQREEGAQSLWAARCSGGEAYAVFVQADGGAQVATCASRGEGGQPLCASPGG